LAERKTVGLLPVRMQGLELGLAQRPLSHGRGRLCLPLHSSTIRDAAPSRVVSSWPHSEKGRADRNIFHAKQPIDWLWNEETSNQARAAERPDPPQIGSAACRERA